MNKAELITAISEEAGLTKKDAEKALDAFTDTVSKALAAFVDTVTETLAKGDSIQLVGFGTFETTKRAAREGRNPQSGKTVKIAASVAPKFKAGKALKDIVNK